MEAETTPQQPTTTTTIRSSDPDLTIYVGEGEQQKIYVYHGQIMAMHSRYIDTMLATPMCEQETRTIYSAIWENIIGYLQPGALPPQTLHQVRAVLPFVIGCLQLLTLTWLQILINAWLLWKWSTIKCIDFPSMRRRLRIAYVRC